MAKDFSKAKASSTLKNVADKSRMLSNTKVIVKLPVDKLIDHPDNEYLFGMKQEDIDHMAEGIAQNGFTDPIEVYDNQDGTYLIYSGHIRKYGAYKNGMTEIDSIVKEKPEENIIRRELLGANLFGRNRIDNSDPILVARQLEYHMETLNMENFKGNKRKQIAKDFGFKSDANVHKYTCLLALIPELQKKVSKRIISYSGIGAASKMEKEEQELLNAALDEKLKSEETVTRDDLVLLIRSMQTGEEKQLEGQMDITDYPEMIPDKVIDDSKMEMPSFIEETEDCHEEIVPSINESAKTDKKEDVEVEVVHREQPTDEIKEINETTEPEENSSIEENINYTAGGVMDSYMRNIKRLFEKNKVINYENMKESLTSMKVVNMMLEDEIDRISDLLG